MSGRGLIVNADDFGISEPVNEGIVRSHVEGIVTSTTILATGDAFDSAVRLARQHASLDVGLHLALVGQRPLLAAARIPSLVGPDGEFHPSVFSFTRRYVARRVRDREIEQELDAQLEKARAAFQISHVDSHQHVHMLPGVRAVVVRLCRRHGIRAMRWAAEPVKLRDLLSPRRAARAAQSSAVRLASWIGPGRQIATPDQFVGFMDGGRLDEAALMRVLAALPARGTCELMCHPGLPEASAHYPEWGYGWDQELMALTSPAIRTLVDSLGIRLLSYRDWLETRLET